MANICDFEMWVIGEDRNVNSFSDAIQQDGNIWVGRGATIDEFDKEEILPDKDISLHKFYGDTKWSIQSSLIDDAYSMAEQKRNGSGMWSDIDQSTRTQFLSLVEACKKFNVDVEIYSEEPGCEFEEHFLIINGELEIENCVEMYEFDIPYWRDYVGYSYKQFIDEFDYNIDERTYMSVKEPIKEGGFEEWSYDEICEQVAVIKAVDKLQKVADWCGFDIAYNDDHTFSLIDRKDVYLGGENSYKNIKSLSNVLERLDPYINDQLYKDIEEQINEGAKVEDYELSLKEFIEDKNTYDILNNHRANAVLIINLKPKSFDLTEGLNSLEKKELINECLKYEKESSVIQQVPTPQLSNKERDFEEWMEKHDIKRISDCVQFVGDNYKVQYQDPKTKDIYEPFTWKNKENISKSSNIDRAKIASQISTTKNKNISKDER